MSEPSKLINPQPPHKDAVRVSRIYFNVAIDFPGEQKDSLTPTVGEITTVGTQYACWFLPAWNSFEVTQFRSGKPNGPDAVQYIPAGSVKRWNRAL